MSIFGAAHGCGMGGGGGGGGKKAPLAKICHRYPAMIKLGTATPYLK